jgi:Uma2 family endonuclease
MSTATRLLTAEEYFRLPDDGRRTELVRGRMIEMSRPGGIRGRVCARIVYRMEAYRQEHDTGHVLSNDTGIITERGPDTVRGADVCWISYARLPKQMLPEGYPDVAPNLVYEVRSPNDRWPAIRVKIEEYLACGVEFVVVVDPQRQNVRVYTPDEPDTILQGDDVLAFPQLLPGFSVPVRLIFE